ncbi:ribonuclease E [Arthrobacter pigmenti]|uniref:Ribonuclease E n=1 Tax=Arthrobacter pigmenti TaxID=271432 RepID=A0A846RKF0_9MICC|nr:ribonuclease E/G [Arthrobacter pigmenti]NJC22150.1 ribonuclease E [Arthrobacter pigmenti]
MDTNASDTSEATEVGNEQAIVERKPARTRRKKAEGSAAANTSASETKPEAEAEPQSEAAPGTLSEQGKAAASSPRRRTTRSKKADAQTEISLPAAPSEQPSIGADAADVPAAGVPATDLPATGVSASDHADVDAAAGQESAGTGTEPVTRKPARARRTAKTGTASAPREDAGESAVQAPETAGTPETSYSEPKAPVRRRRAGTKVAAPTAGDAEPAQGKGTQSADAESGEAATDAGSSGSETAAGQTPTPEQAPEQPPAEEEAPAKAPRRARATRSRSKKPSEDPATAAETPTPADPTAVVPTAGGAPAEETTAESGEPAPDAGLDPFAVPDSPMSLLFHAPDLTTVVPRNTAKDAPPTETATDDEGDDESGRGRRRNRRSRSRNRAGDGVAGESESKSQGPDESADASEAVTSRRRRRRRRGEEDLELTGGQDDDPPNTVTRVRAPRQSSDAPSDRVTSVKGSTRLEAKKQRRRESRDSGRRRHVITEAEFLARRESVDRQMVVRQRDDRIQIAVMEDGVLAEHFVSKTQQDSLIGNVYLGKVQNVLPSMEAAFIDIGRGRNAVLYAGEVNWDAAGLDGQPRRIELALKSGDSVLVQVTKDPVGHKGARLTSQISLPGRYLVYVPGGSMTGISRKLPDVERNRLKRILKDRLPENAGVIVRTAAEGASEEELTHDINRLRSQWETIEGKASSTKTLAPELLYGEPDLTIKVVRDVFNEDFSKLIVSGEEAWDTIEAYVMYVAPDLVGRLEKWTQNEDIFAARRIDEQIHKALERKVFLPSGGSLVIDRTEAMTVVDVNTGKFTGSGGNLEETVTKNNLEAAEEVVRQLRLRDIGGIIVIDFIDMVLEANRDLVLRRLVECLGRDRTKHQVAEVTSLGLVQMTRKRMGTGLLEVFGENCEHCAGRGVVTHDEPVEHRRHAVSSENHQQHLRQEKMSRSERKRNRVKNQPQEEQPQAAEPKADDAERQARAEAARAALANIAAATHAAHEHEHEHEGHTEQVAASGAVLTINGEKVILPRAESAPVSTREEPRLTLESLTEAFNRYPSAEPVARPEASVEAPRGQEQSVAPAQEAQPGSRGRRARRHRSASSAQGSASDATIERRAAESNAAAGAQYVAKVHRDAPKETPAEEPMILGVGVPASDL